MTELIPFISDKLYIKYKQDRKSPKIIHWAGEKSKPWLNPSEDLADIWWSFARKTPFYEEILQRSINQGVNGVSNYKKYKIKYICYKILSKITFGKTHKKYKQKQNDMKARMRQNN